MDDETETTSRTEFDLKRKVETSPFTNEVADESTVAKKVKLSCEEDRYDEQENIDDIEENSNAYNAINEDDNADGGEQDNSPSSNDSGIEGSPAGPVGSSAVADGIGKAPQGSTGPECLMRCNFHIKQTNGQISLEATIIGGSLGKDGLNQLLQYIKNQIYKRD